MPHRLKFLFDKTDPQLFVAWTPLLASLTVLRGVAQELLSFCLALAGLWGIAWTVITVARRYGGGVKTVVNNALMLGPFMQEMRGHVKKQDHVVEVSWDANRHIMMFQTDGDGRWIRTNEALEQFIEATPDQLLGLDWQNFLEEEEHTPICTRYASAIFNRSAFDCWVTWRNGKQSRMIGRPFIQDGKLNTMVGYMLPKIDSEPVEVSVEKTKLD